MAALVPAEVSHLEVRFLSVEFESGDGERVPESVIDAAGLPTIDPVGMMRRRSDSTLVLNLFAPRVEGDSIRVLAEWLVFPPDQTFWGTDYHYHLRCRRECELLRRIGPGFLN